MRRSPSPLTYAVALAAAALAGCAEGGQADESAPANETTAAAPYGEIASRRANAVELKLVPKGAVLGSDPDPQSPSLVFQAREEPARLLGWLRATANGADLALESEMQEGAEHVLSGRVRETGEAYTVRIAPGANGGTTGTIIVADR